MRPAPSCAAPASILGKGARMVIGVDLEKDERVLYDAYNDAAGVTARFNLNVLHRINRELGGNFDIGAFIHRAIYNRDRHRIEMHLISKKAQTVRVLGSEISHSAPAKASTPRAATNTASSASPRWRAARAGRRWNPGPTRPACFRFTRWWHRNKIRPIAPASANWRHYCDAVDRSEIDSQAATTTISAEVTIESISGDSSPANQPRAQSAMMPTPWESCSQPRMVCLNRMVPIRNSKRAADRAQHRPWIGMPAGMLQHEFIGHRRDDDAGDDRQMQVGIGEPRQPPRLARIRNQLGTRLGALVEIDPPHRERADKGRQEGRDHFGGPGQIGKCRAGHDDGFPERDDDEPRAALGHMAALDVPVRDRGRAIVRYPEPRRGRDVFDR